MFSLISLTENVVNFKKYEEKVLELSRKVGSNSIKTQLEKIDEDILWQRDRKIFRCKGKKRLDFKTTLAEVEIFRRVYLIDKKLLETMTDKETNLLYIAAKNRMDKGFKTICILDELLQLKKFGKLSEGVVEIILKYIPDNSYRKTAQILNDITGLNISASAVWNIVMLVGTMLKEKEIYELERTENNHMKAKNKDNHILFNELDGVYFTLQGTDRKQAKERYMATHPEAEESPKSVRKKELKIVTIYEGWKKEGKNRNKLINKKIFAQVIDNVKVKTLTHMYIRNTYDEYKLKLIVRNSDGGTWTKEKSSNNSIYQLDYFHVKQMIYRQVREKEDVVKIIKLLNNKEYLQMMEFCEELKHTYDGEIKEVEKLVILQDYIKKNMNNFKRYQDTALFKNIKKEGFTYNNLGTQEATNYATITKRMKRRRMSFSIQGADNLSRVIAMTGSYDYDGISNIFNVQTIPQKEIDEIDQYIKNIELNIERQKENIKKRKIKYNDSFNSHIPGLEIKSNETMFNIRNIVYG